MLLVFQRQIVFQELVLVKKIHLKIATGGMLDVHLFFVRYISAMVSVLSIFVPNMVVNAIVVLNRIKQDLVVALLLDVQFSSLKKQDM